MITNVTEKISLTDGRTAASTNLAELGFKAVLCLDRSSFDDRHSADGLEVVLEHIEPRVTSPRFSEVVTRLGDLIRKHGKVLVHCNKGQVRSVAVVAGFLTREQGANALDILRHISTIRDSVGLIPRSLELAVLNQQP